MKFKPEDFGQFSGAQTCAEIANAKLAKWLKDAPVIRKAWPTGDWFMGPVPQLCQSAYSHKAKLVDIEKLP